ncbi:MAG: general secretion pathway protein GspH [Microcoleus sp. SU_5_6]|nr:general secretion pathway protein GspH [Microcoleus sp. SU_5_6]NJL65839.1 general secretion pathway protein GspH [Microcoleus sp. SM1_3_4]
MSQQKSKSNSILPKGCGCSLLIFIGVIGAIMLFPGLFLTFGIKDKQVEIFVPSFLSMANKARQSEAKQYVASMNKGQQAYFAENSTFGNSISDLGLGIKTETNNYKYSIRVTQRAAFSYSLPNKNQALKSYFGSVFLVPAQELDRNAMTTVSILCETNEDRPLIRFKPTDEPAEPIYQNGEVICGKGTTELTR